MLIQTSLQEPQVYERMHFSQYILAQQFSNMKSHHKPEVWISIVHPTVKIKVNTNEMLKSEIYKYIKSACVESYTWICSNGTSNVNDSLKYGFNVRFLMVVFFFFRRLFPWYKAIFTYGSGEEIDLFK